MCIEKSIFCVTEQPDTISLRVRIMVFKIAYVLYETIYYFKEKFPKTLIWNPNFRNKLENVLICVGIFSIRIYSWLHKIIIVSSVSTMYFFMKYVCVNFFLLQVFSIFQSLNMLVTYAPEILVECFSSYLRLCMCKKYVLYHICFTQPLRWLWSWKAKLSLKHCTCSIENTIDDLHKAWR